MAESKTTVETVELIPVSQVLALAGIVPNPDSQISAYIVADSVRVSHLSSTVATLTPPTSPLIFTQSFSAATNVIVNHNLGHSPAGIVVKSTGGLVLEVSIIQNNPNQLTLNFDVPMDGEVAVF